MNIHRIIPQTSAEGPGKRFALWTQGCSRHCKGCMLPETWSFGSHTLLSVEEILDKISNTPGIEGVTVLGGEPFEQSRELAELLAGVRKMGLSTIVFTGFTLRELELMENHTLEALRHIDVLVDGEYIEALRSFQVPMIGSQNQRFHFLTDRYRMEDIPPNKIEMRIAVDGSIQYNGMGAFEKIKDWWRKDGYEI